MAESRWRRAGRVLRDPWSLLVTAVGAGSAWAVGLPVFGIAGVGVGMLGVAAAVGAMAAAPYDGDRGPAAAERPDRPLRRGTPQFRQIERLEQYRHELAGLVRDDPAPVVGGPAQDALEATDAALHTTRTAASSVDALDEALGRAGRIAGGMGSAKRLDGPVGRMTRRRQELLGSITTAVDGVGEVFAKLLELSATSADSTYHGAGPDPVAEVNNSLDTVREVLAELATASRNAVVERR
ncbi:hypothetical protein GIS00_21575 [Nakamurella sp. YIM 132087]|uniref:Uncharacterized protein n=1 Tax=Nakamurella alba TaxID=2665158 RepID=A0A7K1FQV5_9ACTN|nr:hypothetical protein [Nakamurella alba]MTD16531.1 hypothetical protein [Nakamurella alba]